MQKSSGDKGLGVQFASSRFRKEIRVEKAFQRWLQWRELHETMLRNY